ncbi:glycosyltransferase family 2 protein [Fretibacter rubidus]|uniref:glycosyltransferase family 2 protein n=1 Tax=Fretibacter rubidus TaxID=570162 RepID=UPI00352AACE7
MGLGDKNAAERTKSALLSASFANALPRADPSRLSARAMAWPVWAQIIVLVLLTALVISLFAAPLSILSILSLSLTVVILCHSLLRGLACVWSLRGKPQRATEHPIAIWPYYTVLIPLKDEAHMVPSIIKAMSKLDYPQDRLQILLITEANDRATTEAALAFAKPPFHTVINPPGGPKTKPNALNYALQFATGSIITIYDAEDHPHPQQLKQAAIALSKNPQWGALQAPLDYYNASETALSRQFAIEYAALFHVWVPFLARLGLPFPLGGTSNHMRAEALADTNGWDGYNVTEDADLSFRLSALGWQIGYIPMPTDEEAVTCWNPWCDQRARWMKGYMQTWIVHMKAPFAPGGRRGAAKLFTLQITLGASLLSGLFHSLIVAALIGALLHCIFTGQHPPLYPPIIGVTLFSYGVNIAIGAVGVCKAGKRQLLWAVPFMPLYWFVLIVPSWMAVTDLILRPFHWRKTSHGMTHMRPAE